MFTVNKNPSNKELRKFGNAMLIGFFFIGAVVYFSLFIKTWDVVDLEWKGRWIQILGVSLEGLGFFLFGLSYTLPGVAKPVYVVWMTVATFIGTIMTTIMLTVLFIVLLPVFSLIVRLGDPLRKKLTSGGTYWEDYKTHETSIERMKRPF